MTDKFRLLIVEDSPTFAKAMDVQLSNGFSCETVTTLLDARERLHSGDFDAVLLDLMLPDSPDGMHSVQFAKEIKLQLPVVVITAMASRELFHVLGKHKIPVIPKRGLDRTELVMIFHWCIGASEKQDVLKRICEKLESVIKQ